MIKKYLWLLLFVSLQVAAAPVEKWVDADGKTHYGEKAPEDVNASAIKALPNIGNGQSVSIDQVILYSTSWCGYCRQARSYLRRNGIAFQELDIEKDLRAKSAYDRAGGGGVPFLVRGDEALPGFRESSYDRFFTQ